MENREDALKILNLSEAADPGEIETAYRRLVRRFPPEFQPDKFREIDEAYRFLTSVPYQLERLFSSGEIKRQQDPEMFIFPLSPPEEKLSPALSELRQALFLSFLWGSPSDPVGRSSEK